MIKFDQERFEDIIIEALPLLIDNNEEIDLFGLPVDVDAKSYMAADDAGILKIYTARDEGKLVGYCCFFIYGHSQHKTMIMAMQDVIYVDPAYRTCGIRLIRYTEKRLKELGVDKIIHSAPKISRLGSLLERMGYDELETNYIRSL